VDRPTLKRSTARHNPILAGVAADGIRREALTQQLRGCEPEGVAQRDAVLRATPKFAVAVETMSRDTGLIFR
jgi:hypothetical protein